MACVPVAWRSAAYIGATADRQGRRAESVLCQVPHVTQAHQPAADGRVRPGVPRASSEYLHPRPRCRRTYLECPDYRGERSKYREHRRVLVGYRSVGRRAPIRCGAVLAHAHAHARLVRPCRAVAPQVLPPAHSRADPRPCAVRTPSTHRARTRHATRDVHAPLHASARTHGTRTRHRIRTRSSGHEDACST